MHSEPDEKPKFPPESWSIERPNDYDWMDYPVPTYEDDDEVTETAQADREADSTIHDPESPPEN